MKQTVIFQVNGMRCDACAGRLQKALSSQPGVDDVSVSFTDRQARLVYDTSVTNVNRLDSVIRGEGFTTPPSCP